MWTERWDGVNGTKKPLARVAVDVCCEKSTGWKTNVGTLYDLHLLFFQSVVITTKNKTQQKSL